MFPGDILLRESVYEGTALVNWDLALAAANRKNPGGEIRWLFVLAPDPAKYWVLEECAMFSFVVGVNAGEKVDGEYVYPTVAQRALVFVTWA